MGKSTISMAIFNSYVTNYQRVPDWIDQVFFLAFESRTWTKLSQDRPAQQVHQVTICRKTQELLSGKHTNNYGKSPFLMEQSTVNGCFQ